MLNQASEPQPCPRCGEALSVVGLHWLQTRRRDDGYPEEHIHLACPAPGCSFECCALALPGSAPESLYSDAAGAELALARVLGLDGYLPDDPGVVAGYQVRWSRRPQARLIVHKEDADDAVFVLVTGSMPEYQVRGFLCGGEAKQDRFRKMHNTRLWPGG